MNTTLQQPVSPETREVMIALQGLWEFDDPIDGPFIVDWQDLSTFQNYIDNFKNNARGQKIPFFAVHADKTEAAGWLEDMYMAPAVDDNGLPILDEDGKQRTALMGLAEWNSLGQHKIADKQFLYLSPSFQGVWQNPLTKIMYQDVIFEISMTNSPMQKYLKQLKLSERNKVKECDKSKLVNFSEKRKETMATMSDFEIDPEKKKIIEGAQASKEDMKNDKAGAGLSESGAEKVEPPKKTVDEKLKQFEEMLSELSGEFKGKSGNPHAKALGKILSSQYKSLKEKYFPDEEPGDKPGEASEKEPCSGKMSESKEKEKISMSEKRMLSELAELKAFRREAVVDKGMAELEKLDMVKPGEAEFLRNKLISLSEISDTVIHLSEGSNRKIDLSGDFIETIKKCCYSKPMHNHEKGTGAPQDDKKISLSEKKLALTREHAEKNNLKKKDGTLDISTAAMQLSAMKAYDGLTE